MPSSEGAGPEKAQHSEDIELPHTVQLVGKTPPIQELLEERAPMRAASKTSS